LLSKDEHERRALEALTTAHRGQRYANVSEADGRLLRQLKVAVSAEHVVELGTSTRESGIWLAIALRKNRRSRLNPRHRRRSDPGRSPFSSKPVSRT
jgi:predicted O-methyltransferase YrrM